MRTGRAGRRGSAAARTGHRPPRDQPPDRIEPLPSQLPLLTDGLERPDPEQERGEPGHGRHDGREAGDAIVTPRLPPSRTGFDRRRHREHHAERSGQAREVAGQRSPPPRALPQSEKRTDRAHQEQRLGVGPHEHERGRRERQQRRAQPGRAPVAEVDEDEPVQQRRRRERRDVRDEQEGDALVAAEKKAESATRQRIQREEPERLVGQRVVALAGDLSVEGAVPREQPLVKLDREPFRIVELAPQAGDARTRWRRAPAPRPTPARPPGGPRRRRGAADSASRAQAGT